jgi:[ribosomal protein S18]-alanine N-acetyltransferase
VSVVPRRLGRVGDDARGQVVVERMRRRHLRQAMPIEEQAYPTSWSRAVFESELDQVRGGSRHYVVARRRREVVGYAGVWIIPEPEGGQAHVTNIVVASPHRRMGVATRLLVELANEIIGRGCVAWTLEVRSSSDGAQALYRRFGFVPAGVRKNYYDNREDAIVMWCHDIDTPEYADRLSELAS